MEIYILKREKNVCENNVFENTKDICHYMDNAMLIILYIINQIVFSWIYMNKLIR